MGETYYELLGVSREATDEEIETAYREKLKETHPDVSDESDAQERTKRLIQAKDVLTDEKERERYDRLGHQKYVSLEEKAEKSGEPGSESNVNRATTSASAGSTTRGATSTTAGATNTTAGGTSTESSSTNFSGQGTTSTSWYDSGHRSRRERRRQATEGEDSQRAWDTDGSYAVSTDNKSSLTGDLFSSERAFVMLAVTFMVYPVLLFGSLFPGFPMVFRLIIGVCTLLVIAFLQSVPEVGIAVFATWSILLPLVLFSAGTSLFALESLLALTAVVVPLALSVMTRMTLQAGI